MTADVRRAHSLIEIWHLFWTGSDAYVKGRLALALGLTIASAVITAISPIALKYAIDGFTQRSGNGFYIFLFVGLYVLGLWFARNLTELRVLVHGQADRRMNRSLSDRLFNHILHLPLRFHLERQTGAINETLTNGLFGYQLVLQVGVYTVLPVLVQLAVVATVLVHLKQPIFLALFMVAVVLYAVTFGYGAVRITKAARAASDAQVEARGVMTDAIINFETVKFFTAESVVRDKVDAAQGRTEFQWLRFYKSRTRNGLAVAAVFAIFLGITVVYAAREVFQGRMTVGDFVLINTYLLQLVQPLETVGFALQQTSQGVAFLQKMLELFREKTEPVASVAGTSAPMSTPGELAFENVRVAYRSDRSVLRDVSFTVPRGKTVGIVGASGQGKSTIVRVLVRLLEVDGGRICLDGIPIARLPLPVLRQSIAVVPQDTVLFNDTIAYNIGFGRRGSTQEEIEAAARVAHLHDFVMAQPDGYQTRVGERGLKLSGGEKQRVAIARAALKRPRIYVFDEATSSLDSHTEKMILANLRELSLHATTLVIAHRLSTLVHADEIVVLHDGAIVEQATHEELLRLNGHYAKLWRAQIVAQPAVLGSQAAAPG